MEFWCVLQSQQQPPGWLSYLNFLLRVYLANRKIIGIQLTSSNSAFTKYHIIYIASRDLTFTLKTRMVVAAWCLAGIVFVNAYTSSLVSYLMSPRYLPLINTVQDLADSHKLHIAVRKFTFEYSTMMVSNIRNILCPSISIHKCFVK